jgi:radical SAM protein with 4Fe4S-binding SPASM domain
MIDLTQLLSPTDHTLNSIRYAKSCADTLTGVKEGLGPVVAWNITQRCNFKCKHCYSSAIDPNNATELTLDEMKNIVDTLKSINVPVILLSGGEPLMHPNIFEIIDYIRSLNIRVSLSTNGSLITGAVAEKLKTLGVGYVGISLDGLKPLNDDFRGVKGAFDSAVQGIRNCRLANQKVGLRMTIHQENIHQVPHILGLMEEEEVHRICFYHLVPSGRGEAIKNSMLTQTQAKDFMDTLIHYVNNLIDQGLEREILTVTNHVDGPYLYLHQLKENPKQAELIRSKLSRNKGNRSGIAIMNIDWNGNVYPDQFSKFMPLGNILTEDIESIWLKGSQALNQLRHKEDFLPLKCKACRWMRICGGNLRARAYTTKGDMWAFDPGCYLEEEDL